MYTISVKIDSMKSLVDSYEVFTENTQKVFGNLEDYFVSEIISGLLNGKFSLNFIYNRDGKYIGYCISRIQRFPSKPVVFEVVKCALKWDVLLNLDEIIEVLLDYACTIGCEDLRFFTDKPILTNKSCAEKLYGYVLKVKERG